MRRRSWAPLLSLAATTVTVPVLAEPRPGEADATAAAQGGASPDDQARAQEQFQRARELYQGGRYREAITKLEIARRLDPKAKDLVMNLGIVHEKLGHFDEALTYLKTYLDMEGVTPQERAKAEAMIKRVEGARRALPPPPAPTATTPPPAAPTAEPQPPSRGRVDGLTITAGTLATIGLVGGGVLGIVALTSRPNDFVTGRDGSYATLEERADTAHTLALAADISLGAGAIAAVIAAWLYLGRTADPPAAKAAGTPRVAAGPVPSGGAVFLTASFQ